MCDSGRVAKIDREWVNATPFVPRTVQEEYCEPDEEHDGPDISENFEEYACFRINAANANSQISFLAKLLPQLQQESLIFIQKHICSLIRADFIGTLPEHILAKLIHYIDISTLSSCVRVCRAWNKKIGPIWVIACQRRRIAVNPIEATREDCITRLKRLQLRLASFESRNYDDVLSIYDQPSLPADDSTLSFIFPSKFSPKSGHLSALVSPGMVVFYPLPESGGVTYFLRTGILDSPSCMHASQSAVFIAYSWGLIQMWAWRSNTLICAIESGENITCLQYLTQFGLLAVGTSQGAIIIWKPLKMELVQCFPPTVPSLDVCEIRFLSCNTCTDGESSSEDSGTWSPTLNAHNHRLFIAYTLQFPGEIVVHPKNIGSRKRVWCSLVVWEIEALTGHAINNIYNVTPEKRGLKSTLHVNRNSNTFLYVSENYELNSYYSPDARLHELNPVTGTELSTALDCYTLNEEGDWAMEWQILGVGSHYAALGLWQLQLVHDNMLTPTSAFIICERTATDEQDNDLEFPLVPMGGETWKQVVGLSSTDLMSSSGTGLFSAFQLTDVGWLDGFDGANDIGHVLTACYWDYVQGGWRLKSFKWKDNMKNKLT